LFHTATRELISGEITAPSYWLLFSLSVATGKKITMFFYYLCNAFSCGICDTSGLLPQILLFAFLAREGFFVIIKFRHCSFLIMTGLPFM